MWLCASWPEGPHGINCGRLPVKRLHMLPSVNPAVPLYARAYLRSLVQPHMAQYSGSGVSLIPMSGCQACLCVGERLQGGEQLPASHGPKPGLCSVLTPHAVHLAWLRVQERLRGAQQRLHTAPNPKSRLCSASTPNTRFKPGHACRSGFEGVNNGMMASAPGLPLWQSVVQLLEERSLPTGDKWKDAPIYQTGPNVLTTVSSFIFGGAMWDQ